MAVVLLSAGVSDGGVLPPSLTVAEDITGEKENLNEKFVVEDQKYCSLLCTE